MFRPSRALPVLLCLFALTTTAVPATAAAKPQELVTINPALLFKTVTVVGAGDTLDLALAHALAEIRTRYFVFSYTTANPLCTEISLPYGNQNQSQTITLCSIEVTARVLRKATWIVD